MEETEGIFTLPGNKVKIDNLDATSTPELYSYLNSQKLQKLHTLRISGNSYSSSFCETLSTYLQKASSLTSCDFNDIFVGRKEDSIPQSLTSLMTGVMALGKLEKIDLSNNAISKNGAEAIAPFLAKQNGLKVFLISNCGLGIAGVSVIAKALKQGTPQLEVIAIARNRAENDGALQLAETIKNLPKLKEIHIYQNFIQEKGMQALITSLQECKLLEIVDIRDNYLKKSAAVAFGELLKKTPKLKGINISDCNLEKEENQIVIQALQESNLDLQKIGYNYNELDDKNGKLLIDQILKSSTKIERLDIKGNDFGKATKIYYQNKMKEINCANALSKFDSDDEEEEQELIKTFSDLKI